MLCGHLTPSDCTNLGCFKRLPAIIASKLDGLSLVEEKQAAADTGFCLMSLGITVIKKGPQEGGGGGGVVGWGGAHRPWNAHCLEPSHAATSFMCSDCKESGAPSAGLSDP